MNGAPLMRTVRLNNPNGLHMRPSAAFVELAYHFESNVTVQVNGRSANGRSMFDLIGLGAECGSEMTLVAEGPDAPEALEALAALLSTTPADA
jgi:phosphocarrier protein HPr